MPSPGPSCPSRAAGLGLRLSDSPGMPEATRGIGSSRRRHGDGPRLLAAGEAAANLRRASHMGPTHSLRDVRCPKSDPPHLQGLRISQMQPFPVGRREIAPGSGGQPGGEPSKRHPDIFRPVLGFAFSETAEMGGGDAVQPINNLGPAVNPMTLRERAFSGRHIRLVAANRAFHSFLSGQPGTCTVQAHLACKPRPPRSSRIRGAGPGDKTRAARG
jgi:hypothetical protein